MGKWMSGLQSQKSSDTHATKTTKMPEPHGEGDFVVSVAPTPEHFGKSKVKRMAAYARQQPPAKREAPVAAVANDELDRQLLEAAMRCCDYWNDGPEARAQMVADIRATPQHHRQELLEHFQAWYEKSK
jgi:hypothetical protein